MDKGLLLSFAKWLRDFLSNRQARIERNREYGRPVPLRRRPPLFFLLYIDNLKTVVPNDVEVAMSADDVSLLSLFRHTRRGVEQASQGDAEHRDV